MSTTDTTLTPLRKRRPTPAASPSGVPLGTNTGGVSKRQRLPTGNVLPRSDNLDSSETEDEEPMRRTVQLPAQARQTSPAPAVLAVLPGHLALAPAPAPNTASAPQTCASCSRRWTCTKTPAELHALCKACAGGKAAACRPDAQQAPGGRTTHAAGGPWVAAMIPKATEGAAPAKTAAVTSPRTQASELLDGLNGADFDVEFSWERTLRNTYLQCPYADKDECKMLGGRWDQQARAWYVPPGVHTGFFRKWLPVPVQPPTAQQRQLTRRGRVDLRCPYKDKQVCKATGGCWDPKTKTWFVPAGVGTADFSRWLPYVAPLMAEQDIYTM